MHRIRHRRADWVRIDLECIGFSTELISFNDWHRAGWGLLNMLLVQRYTVANDSNHNPLDHHRLLIQVDLYGLKILVFR